MAICPFLYSYISLVTPSDYRGLSYTILTFQECDSQQCISIPITDDEALEDAELFTVDLNATFGLENRVGLMGATTTVQISDTDGTSLHDCIFLLYKLDIVCWCYLY